MTVHVPDSKLAGEARRILAALGVDARRLKGADLVVRSPIDGRPLATLDEATVADAKAAIGRAHAAFLKWRSVPGPRRGELVRLLGEQLRAAKAELGRLVTIEVGKVESEGLGEVQEMIDICDFAVGLSRQLYGLTIQSERPDHKLVEAWRPAGVVGVISAFNFPVAVWSWNAALAFVCGDSIVWKPSAKAPLTALATEALFRRAAAKLGPDAPDGLLELLICGRAVGETIVDDPRVPVLSATGSTRMGQVIGERLARRFGRGILELGGNNASIVTPSADLDLTLRAVAFGAMGTAGQRCTSLRRLIVHESVYEALIPKLAKVYRDIAVGDPTASSALVGPLIDGGAFTAMQKALAEAKAAGGIVHGGERVEVNGAELVLRPPGSGRDAGAGRPGDRGDLRSDPLCAQISRIRRGAGAAQRRAAGALVVDLRHRHPRGRALSVRGRLRLRHRQRQHGHFGRRDRRRFRRREGDRRRPRERLRRVEGLHAPPDQRSELRPQPAVGAGRQVRRLKRRRRHGRGRE